MTTLEKTLYTLVEHNGLVNAVMFSAVKTEVQARLVLKNGGLLIDSYEEAEAAEFFYNYNGVLCEQQIYPNASINGVFSKEKHGEDRLFIPSQKVRTESEVSGGESV